MTSTKENLTKIKHLVFSGGSVWGFSLLGMLMEAMDQQFLHMANIESIWATSIGALVGIMMSLKIDPAIIRDYIVKRPWETVCKQNRFSVLEIYDGRGIIHRGFFENILEPLLTSVDLSCKTTFRELYEYNGIEIHIYATEINHYQPVDFSFKTHPDWTLIDAVYASCSIPVLFAPLIRDGKCFVDGGFLLNYPISECVKHAENENEILGISFGNLFGTAPKEGNLNEKSSILDVIYCFLVGIIQRHSLFENNYSPIPYQIIIQRYTTLEYGTTVLYEKAERERLVEKGKQEMAEYLLKWSLIQNSQTESDSAL